MVVRAFVTVSVKEGCFDSFMEALEEALPPIREEPGNLRFDAFISEDQANTVVIFEEWKDHGSITEHLATSHMKRLLARTEGQLVGPAQANHVRPLKGNA
ncbi:putative quinol monooxygenase [Streptomyces sp. NPDC020883]|uniref:putative quinol monooxygenase n=1 Tax=Streptomyces sp. NPDC020883 TaxID=3365099 RepID=UPI00379CC546